VRRVSRLQVQGRQRLTDNGGTLGGTELFTVRAQVGTESISREKPATYREKGLTFRHRTL
jgi:hypothetical protein